MISVIIPVYNTAAFIHKCINSVLTQTYQDIEVILIDDGSTDESGDICTNYCLKDKRVQLIKVDNGGVSRARNIGLNNAKGDWIIFLDSDDFWSDTTILETMLNEANKNKLEVVRAEYYSVDQSGEEIEQREYYHKIPYTNQSLTPFVFIDKIINGEFFLVLCLIKSSAINNLRFDTKMKFLEDAKFLSTLLNSDIRCGYLKTKFYAYRKLGSSASRDRSIKNIEDAFSMCEHYWNLSENAIDTDFSKYCKKYSVMMYYWTLLSLSDTTRYPSPFHIMNALNLKSLHTKIRQRCKIGTIPFKSFCLVNINPRMSLLLMILKSKFARLIK